MPFGERAFHGLGEGNIRRRRAPQRHNAIANIEGHRVALLNFQRFANRSGDGCLEFRGEFGYGVQKNCITKSW